MIETYLLEHLAAFKKYNMKTLYLKTKLIAINMY